MENHENYENDQISLQDLINSLSYMKASEAGLLPSDMSISEMGVVGSMTTDLINTYTEFKEGNVSKEEATEKVKDIIITGAIAIAIQKIAKFVAFKASASFPVLSPVIHTVSYFVTSNATKIAKTVAKKVKKFFKWLGF